MEYRGVECVYHLVGAVREPGVPRHVLAGVLQRVLLREFAELLPGDGVGEAAGAVVHPHRVRSAT